MTNKRLLAKPIKFNPLYKEKIWGGQNLASVLNKEIPGKNIGESWELSAIVSDVSYSSSGISINDYITTYKEDFLGSVFKDEATEFPLLYKFIDAQENLSIQVHPDDTVVEGEIKKGKTECWYIVDAVPDAKIIVGFIQDVSSKVVKEKIDNNSLEGILDYIPIKKGDVLFIPAGTVHAIMKGTVIYELQESSDITYRLYDWGRLDNNGKGRELHIDQSLEILNYKAPRNYLVESKIIAEKDNYKILQRAQCKFFNLEEWHLLGKGSVEIEPRDAFTVITVLSGEIKVNCSEGEELCCKGETILLPANCQDEITVEYSSNSTFLYSYVP